MAITVFNTDSHLKYILPQNRKAFLQKVEDVSKYLQINPNWLMGIMYHESGINPAIVNSIGATGLIQFMPNTAKGLGVSTAQLAKMSGVQQMDYVLKYFEPYKGKIRTMTGLYVITFFPVALQHTNNNDYVFQYGNLSASVIAQDNPAFDINKDGKITMGEYKKYLEKYFGADLLNSANPYFGKDSPKPSPSKEPLLKDDEKKNPKI